MQYSYKAISQAGTEVSGTVHAESPEQARDKLAAQGLIPTRVFSGPVASGLGLGERISYRLTRVSTPDLVLFTKQFRTLFNAGISITALLEVLEQQTENLKLKKAAASMGQEVKAGSSLNEAFKKHPDIFSHLYCSMIQAGESSGRLEEVLERLIYLLQHEHRVKSDIKSALQYPVLVLLVLGLAFFFLLAFVVPRFADIFTGAGIDLPLTTQASLFLYHSIVVYWPVTLTVLFLVIFLLRKYFRTEKGAYNKDYLLLKLPILGPVFQKGAMSRFASVFAILQASGVSVLNTLSILSGTIGNSAIAREFTRIQDQLKEGRGISSPLRSARFFPPMVINMVAIGEESGNLDQMLHEISVHYDDEVSYAVNRLSETIGPVLIVFLAAMVGFFALAIFLPMWELVRMV